MNFNEPTSLLQIKKISAEGTTQAIKIKKLKVIRFLHTKVVDCKLQ